MDREFPQPDLGCTIVLDSSPRGYTVHWHGPPDEEAARARAERLLQDAQDLTLERYQNRAQAAPRVMARWAAGNDLRLAAYSPPLDGEGNHVPEPDPGDYEDQEDYQAALAAWLAIYDPDVHGWAPRLFATFMAQVGPVVALLNSLAFGATAQAVQAFSHPLATPAAKQAYLADMAAEGALPS